MHRMQKLFLGTHTTARGNLYGDYFAGGKFAGGNFATLGIPKAPNCLTHTLTCKPMLCSEADRFANQMATESSTTSQHLKESAVPNTCPQTMDPKYAAPLASSLHCQHP